MQINQANLAALYKGYRTLFLAAMHGAKPMWQNFAMRTPSSAAEEIYHWLGAVPGMQKLLGEITIKNLSAHKYSIPNDEWVDTVAVKQADIERDTYGIYNPLVQAMGFAAAQHIDELVASLLVNGFTELAYDGKAFFATNHKRTARDVAWSNKGTKKLSAANFADARTSIKSRLNAEGRPMNLGIDLVLVVSPKYESTGRQIVVADLVAGGETNVNKGTARLEVWPQLAANEDAWFLLEAGHPVKPLIFQEEKPTALMAVTNPDSDHVLKHHEFLYQGYGRYGAGYALPELAWGSTGADAA